MIIVLFHVLYLFGKFVYQNYRIKKQKAISNEVINTQKPLEISENDYRMRDPEAPQDFEQKSIKFFPPAYVQRYVAVSNVLNSPKYQGKLCKAVDFGCAELDFLVYLKNTTGIKEILCVDTDRVLLESYKHKGGPLISEYLHTRTTPLVVEICEGSVTHNDKKLEKTDAVICIELIEHLYPDTLEELPYNIFGFIKPKLAIITTPNADFNVLFPNFSGFRHPDHKFEWTRQQFQDWAENVITRYPDYVVTFEGICKGPEGSEDLGCCTQMAIFHRLSEKDSCNTGIEGLFVTVAKYEYPFRVDNRSDEQKILDEAEYYIRHLSFQDSDMEEEVPLTKLLDMLKSFHISIELLQAILEEAGWTVTNRELGPVVLVPPHSTFSDYSTVGESFWSNGYNSSDENEWNRDPGPPANSRFLEPDLGSEIWDNENWNDEPSIVIPQNNSVIEDNTYLFDEENILSNNISETIRDIEISEKYSETNSEGTLAPEFSCSSTTDHTSIDVLDHSFQCNLPSDFKESARLPDSSFNTDESSKNDSFVDLPYSLDTQQSTLSDTTSKLNRTLDFLPCMSVSRASTSPEPYLLQTVKMDQHLTHDSMCNQSMSNHWMLNNSLEQTNESLNITASASNVEDKKLLQENNFNDNLLRNIYVNTSYKEPEDSDFELLSSKESVSPKYSNSDQVQSVQQELPLSSNTSISSYTLTESQPQFTSSPKVSTKVNTVDKKRRSLDLNRQTNSSSSLKGLQQSCLTSLSSNNLLENKCEISLGSNSKTNCNENKKPFRTHDIEILEDKKDLTDKCNDDTLVSSGVSMSNEKQMAKDLSTRCSLSSNNSANRHELIQLDLASTLNAIKEQPNFCVVQTAEQNELAITHTSSLESINCDKQVPVTVKSEPCLDFVIDKSEGKTETKSELHDICNLRSDKNTDTTESYNHAKEISSLECVHLVSSVRVENTQNVQSTSVLTNEKQIESNIENHEFACKSVNPNDLETVETIELKSSPETVETPPKSWSPEVMDSGYPNSTSAPDMTPEYDLSSIAQDHISDSEPPSIAEAPRLEAPEIVEVVNGDLVNNNRDNEGNNMIAAELNDLEDLQPLIDVLENDLENENDIYVLENGFPFWLLRILNMANPIDVEMHMRDHREMRFPNEAAGDDVRYMNIEHDEGFNSSSAENSNLENNEMENDGNSDASYNIENDNENVSNSDSGSEEWAAAGDS
nr:PREDICTED: uncharacterized protein LOC100881302 [Megachile rotundata]